MTTLQTYLKKNLPIFVKNMTRKPDAMVAINFRYNGNTQTIYIPPSTYPFEITSMVSPKMIREGGSELQSFLATGVLVLVGPKKARLLLKDAGDELNKIFIRANNPTAARSWAQKTLEVSEGVVKGDHSQEQDKEGNPYVFGPAEINRESLPSNNPMLDLQKRIAEAGDSPSRASYQLAMGGGDTEVNPRVLGIMTGWSNETDEGVLAQLKSQASLMSEYDFNYVLSHCARGSRTSIWAKQKADKNNLSKYNGRESE